MYSFNQYNLTCFHDFAMDTLTKLVVGTNVSIVVIFKEDPNDYSFLYFFNSNNLFTLYFLP